MKPNLLHRVGVSGVALLALGLAACAGDDDDGGQSGNPDASVAIDAADYDPDAMVSPALATFRREAAESVCGALFRCCDDGDVADYFASMKQSELLKDFASQLPPASEAACVTTLEQIYDIIPFGDWVRAAERGDVVFHEDQFAACRAALDGASCGAELRAALYDSTCLGFGPPGGGSEQRKIFTRTQGVGATCEPVRDGVGAAFFGTCDPTVAYCCYIDPANPNGGCGFPVGKDGAYRSGSCVAAAAEGQSCQSSLPVKICKTGLYCNDANKCEAPGEAELQVGDICAENFNTLGECKDSWCDLLGTNKCEALKADGATCQAGYECTGGACVNQKCAVPDACTGTGMMPDAGVPAADAAPVTPDAAPVMPDAAPMATGETCGEAIELGVASTASMVPGYAYRVAGDYGAANDYNPYKSANPKLPPACSFVYDASGAEKVYAVTLQPGDNLKMRMETVPTNVAPAVYLLDTCSATPTWPDYDDSGSCGNNEYKTQGFCSLGLCDTLEWTWVYPKIVKGSPTVPKTFYLVLDAVGAGTSFTFDWKITPNP